MELPKIYQAKKKIVKNIFASKGGFVSSNSYSFYFFSVYNECVN